MLSLGGSTMQWSTVEVCTHLWYADIEMECLATWKDGSETYLYARLTGAHLHSRDQRYRCFVSRFTASRCLRKQFTYLRVIAAFGLCQIELNVKVMYMCVAQGQVISKALSVQPFGRRTVTATCSFDLKFPFRGCFRLHLTQCGIGRGQPLYQAEIRFVQPFRHNTHAWPTNQPTNQRDQYLVVCAWRTIPASLSHCVDSSRCWPMCIRITIKTDVFNGNAAAVYNVSCVETRAVRPVSVTSDERWRNLSRTS